jgi:hypothetical protein
MNSHHQGESIVVIATFNDLGAAVSAKEKLAEAGINANIEDMDVMGMTPTAGIEVKIFEKDLEKAKSILGIK